MAGAHSYTPAELKAQIEAEREGRPFLVHRDGAGDQVIVVLDPAQGSVTVGRSGSAAVALTHDPEVSRLHGALEPIGEDWTITDEGLSRNGSFVNGERVTGRRRLREGDSLRFGNTTVTFRDPRSAESVETQMAAAASEASKLTETQKKVLVALCRPFKDGGAYATPATNQQIAEELFLSVDAIKAHLRVLFEKFSLGDLPQNRKRTALVEQAFHSGAIVPRDLSG